MLLNQPWATTQMLGLLAQQPPVGQPGQPMPAPAAPMNVPDTAPQQNIFGRIHDLLQNKLGGSAPAGWEGILSPQEIQQAKPGLMQILGHSGAYETNLERIAALKAAADQMKQQNELRTTRSAMGSLFPAGENETREQTAQRLSKMYSYAVNHGDMEMAKELGTRMDAMTPPVTNPTNNLKAVPGVGLVDVSDPNHPKTVVAAPEKEITPSFSAVPGIDPATGKPVVYTLNTRTGQMVSTGVGKPLTGAGSGQLAAPMAAKVGQAGEMIKKAADLLPLMQGMNPDIGGSAAQDIAEHGVGAGHFLRIPGSRAVGSMMLNKEPSYAQYQASLSPFVLAAAHALSGARINQDQVEQIRNSIELKPGDFKNPTVRAQKQKNLIDLVNSISGSLPADAIASQEDQMEPALLKSLKGFGYRGANRTSAGAVAPSKPKLTQAQYDAGRARGLSKEKIAEHYDISGVNAK